MGSRRVFKVRIYDASTRGLARLQRLSTNDGSEPSDAANGGGGGVGPGQGPGVTALCYSPDGAQLLVGVGGGVDVLDPQNLAEVSP